MTEPVIRALTESDAHLFNTLHVPALVGRARFGHTYRTRAEGGDYRPDWTWVALRDDRVVARAAWWGAADDTKPITLDWFDFADGEADAAAELLRTAPLRAEYSLMAAPGWREPDDAVITDVLRRVMSGTLDAHDRRAIAQGGVDAAVRELTNFLSWCPSPREWWRLAWTPEGEPVGIQVPAHNPSGPCIGYIGVVEEQRGHGYAYDLLVECTHDLVERGATKIAAATDQPNLPMAAHFAKAGYPITQERIDLV
jgi:hypothetical protein